MHKVPRVLLACVVAGVMVAGPLGGPASAGSETITLRVAPEGFVVPSHWLVQNDAVWIVDPAENHAFNPQDGVAGCEVAVPDANSDGAIDGGEVLDRATETGCISGWDFDSDGGRFVTEVDGLEQAGWPASWWLIQIDGHGAATGIDDMDLQSGQSLEFVYLLGP